MRRFRLFVERLEDRCVLTSDWCGTSLFFPVEPPAVGIVDDVPAEIEPPNSDFDLPPPDLEEPFPDDFLAPMVEHLDSISLSGISISSLEKAAYSDLETNRFTGHASLSVTVQGAIENAWFDLSAATVIGPDSVGVYGSFFLTGHGSATIEFTTWTDISENVPGEDNAWAVSVAFTTITVEGDFVVAVGMYLNEFVLTMAEDFFPPASVDVQGSSGHWDGQAITDRYNPYDQSIRSQEWILSGVLATSRTGPAPDFMSDWFFFSQDEKDERRPLPSLGEDERSNVSVPILAKLADSDETDTWGQYLVWYVAPEKVIDLNLLELLDESLLPLYL
jgi:hypothetical protein